MNIYVKRLSFGFTDLRRIVFAGYIISSYFVQIVLPETHVR